ncbi:MAG TPA: hypothetical protein VJ906_06990 [Roseovarius sp.]|nr:hypothetical protein [Roseovarius sp.]
MIQTLTGHWFLTLADAAETLEPWRSCCNEECQTARSATKPDHAGEIGGHHQPVTLIDAGKLSPRAVEGSGRTTNQRAPVFKRMKVQWQVTLEPVRRINHR